ncbi:MAG: autotransporter-associated beta strand repeat-containing protein, partial [Verrucomicrobiota bacterium]
MKNFPRLAAAWAMAVAWLAMGLSSRTHAQTAASNNFVSANLNGAASYTLPTITSIGGAITVEGWVYPRSHAPWQRIVDIGNGAGNNNVLLAASQSTTGKPIFELYSGGSVILSIVSSNALPLNTWSHVAGVLGSDLSGKLYINGQLVASGTATALPPSVSRSSGFLAKSNWSPDALLDGALGEVRIWNVARTQAQIQATMAAGSITGATTGLLMDYPFGVTGSSALLDISGSNLHLTQVGTVNYSKFMSGSLVAAGFRGSSTVGIAGGSLAITGSDNDYTGATTVSAGTSFTLGNGGTTGSPGSGGIANSGTVAFNRSNELTVGNLISGTGAVTQSGSGTTILTAANSYTGTTTVAAGTLEVLARVASSTAPYVVSAGGTLKIGYDTGADYGNPAFTVHGAGVASQAGLQVMGGKTLISNPGILLDTAPSTIRSYGTGSGTLRGFDINSSYFLKTTAAASGSVVDSGVSIATGIYGYKVDTESGANTATGDLLLRGPISGTPGLFKVGTGRLVLSANNSYAGSTTISAGTLQVGEGGTSGTLGSGSVANNAALSFNRSDSWTLSQVVSGTGTLRQAGTGTTILTGANTYSGTTTVSAGTLQVGNGGTAGTLGSGAVVNNSTLTMNRSDAITLANAVSGSGRLVKQGAQTLTLSGSVTSTGGIIVQGGTLLFSGATGLANDAANTITVENGAIFSVNRHDTFGTHDATVVTPIVVNSGGIFRNEAGWFNVLGPVTLRGGTLQATATHSSGYSFPLKGTVTVDGGAATSTLSGPGIGLGGAAVTETTFDVLDGAATDDLLVSSALLNGPGNILLQPMASSGLRKIGAGRMTLTANNTYSGTTTVSAGTLQVGNGGTAGTLGLGAVVNNAQLVFNRSDAVTLANAISGLGTLTKSGAGTLTVNTTQTYTGGTVIDGGTLRIGIDGSSAGVIRGDVSVGPQGTLLLSGVNGLGWGSGSKVNAITINGGMVETTASGDQGWGVAYLLNGGELRSNGGVSSTGATSYYAMGAGTTVTTLANANPALITGRIILREGNPNDFLPFNVADGSAAIDLLVSASITPQSTTGSLTKSGAGTMVLSGQNTYAGVTTISAGTLQVGNGGTTGTLGTGNVVNNASLAWNRSDSFTVANPISGTGSIQHQGSGTLTLTGANTYSGITTVSAGRLQVGDGGTSGSLGSGNVVNNASLAWNRSDSFTVANPISGTG